MENKVKKTIKLFGKMMEVGIVYVLEDAPADHLVNQEQETETASSSRAVMPPRRELVLPQGASLITERRLEASDVASTQSRFFLPISEEIDEVLTQSERVMLLEKFETVKVKVVDSIQRCYDMDFKKWPSVNDRLVLNHGWMQLVKDNHLQKGDVVELWSYRQDSRLCFAVKICERSKRNISSSD
ncbi:B3 domain-containing protein At1g05920-like [Coffea eugenioides]|uniref:B3 domain-containing protein At1g05920-like n=1 Tax=Coffea eugenioides TaxID=49369 RepID=UPI000F609E6D|nr:B3 domain-containing protein At1g05920-like [Coffea eugenioides]